MKLTLLFFACLAAITLAMPTVVEATGNGQQVNDETTTVDAMESHLEEKSPAVTNNPEKMIHTDLAEDATDEDHATNEGAVGKETMMDETSTMTTAQRVLSQEDKQLPSNKFIRGAQKTDGTDEHEEQRKLYSDDYGYGHHGYGYGKGKGKGGKGGYHGYHGYGKGKGHHGYHGYNGYGKGKGGYYYYGKGSSSSSSSSSSKGSW
eukprot:CAMPEP_0197238038 /NCGR_PEP_ID=MMETSP1429-20130617/4670_1 /TAXON_ID=49237 /ORGANISM="Chaetoceros  sp., Strain UNC1202" /LENGTH=204 /DNA_ID=CAMNT_0042697131 /DNA_START=45 /DNA_END=656 /DNA_ORIENTATION=-